MNCKILLFALVAAIGTGGCITDPRASGDEPAGSSKDVTVSGLSINARDRETVRLRWLLPEVKISGTVYAYKITWQPWDNVISTPHDTGTQILGDFQTTKDTISVSIYHLQPKMFNFKVQVMTDYYTTLAASVSVAGAPAARYVMDQARPGERLRLYEPGSSQGNGLTLDPSTGGPTRLVPDVAPAGALQFVLRVGGGVPEGHFRITAAHILPEYSAADRSDPTVVLFGNGAEVGPSNGDGDDFDSGTMLDDWYMYGPLDVSDDTHSGLRFSLFDSLLPQKFDHPYYNFFIRTGNPNSSNYRVVRISVVGQPDGTLLRGEAPNRYVELEISLGYPGVPFA